MPKNSTSAQPSVFDQTVALYQQGRFQEALEMARHGLTEQPTHVDLLNVAAAAAYAAGAIDEAERHWRAAIEERPDFADAYSNLGNLLHGCGRLEEAEAAYRHALTIQPQHAEAYNNLGNLLYSRGQMEQAAAAYHQAIAIRPQYADAYNNLGTLLKTCWHLDGAEIAYRHALTLQPQHADAHVNLAGLLLLTGRFAEGWRHHEARTLCSQRARVTRIPVLPLAQWKGEPLAGKALLVLPEGGYGDQIQFCRYARLLKDRGAARVDFACDAALTRLLETLEGVDAVIPSTLSRKALSAYDYWTITMSMPLHLDTTLETIPATLPYLRALPERIRRWAPRLPAGGLRVGLVWRGSERLENDANRSLPGLRTLAPLWSVPGVTFVSLQKGAGEDEATAPPEGQPLVHLGSEIQDFADTAAIVSQLDLVICVDTAVGHLTGALGKPCWVLLPRIGLDWRWLLERSDSPWYPGSMRLFRQTTPGDWAGVVAQVAATLAAPPSQNRLLQRPR